MRSLRHTPLAARRGFTIVELLVAAALIVLIMAILATAFSAGLESVSMLKAIGDMSEKLRTTETVMRHDLAAPHFEDANRSPARVSDPRLNAGPWSGGGRMGYFAVGQGTPVRQAISATMPVPPYVGAFPPYTVAPNNTQQAYDNYPYLYEGTDPDMPSYRASDHRIAMTVKLTGKTATDGFTTAIPALPGGAAAQLDAPAFSRFDFNPAGGQFVSQWAEVTYFLWPSGSVTTDNANGTLSTLPVYSLHRRQRALTPYPVQVGTTGTGPIQDGNLVRQRFPDLSIRTIPTPAFNPPAPLGTGPAWAVPPSIPSVDSFTNTPADVTNPLNRMNAYVDWRHYTTGQPVVPQFRDLPAGLAEVFPGAPTPDADRSVVNGERFGSDVLLNNVLSMQIRVMTDASSVSYVDPPYAASNFTWGMTAKPPIPGNMPGPSGLPSTNAFYDTGATPPGVASVRVKAVQIRIRVYDNKSQQTRQITVVQDL